jgi:putative aldouronate transport system substrate-binding protein
MKKVVSLILCIAVIMSFALSVSALKAIPVQSIKLQESSAVLKVGESVSLNVVFTPANTTQKFLTYTTSNKNVASINAAGKVTATGSGTAVITVTSSANGKITAKFTVTVAKKPAPVTLKVFLFGSENAHYRAVDPIIAEFEKETKDTLNTKLKITWTPPADYKDKYPLWVASGEEMDLVFDAPWRYLNRFAGEGVYEDLGGYFNNGKYPGLQKAFSAELLKNNQFYGKNVAIPITNTYMDMEGVFYRQDLLQKYGMKPIASYDDLYAFLDKVAATEDMKKLTPFGTYGKWGYWIMFQEPWKRAKEANIYSFNPGISANYVDIQLAADKKSVASIAAWGEPDSEYRSFNGKYGKQYVSNYVNMARKWNKFVSKDVLVSDAQSGMQYAASYGVLSTYMTRELQQEKDIPGAKLAFWPIHEEEAQMLPGARVTDYKAWNFLCIPTTSGKVERTMQFLDWVYGSQHNNDLFCYGIEGVNWTAVGEDQWDIPKGVDPTTNYMFPAYQIGWSTAYQRIQVGWPEELLKLYKYQFKQDTFTKSAIAGFAFNTDAVKTDVAKCAPIAEKYMQILGCGVNSDPAATLKAMGDELKAAGMENVKAELKKQLNDFLAMSRYRK